MRAIAFGLIILSEIIILLTRGRDVNAGSLSFMTTLIVVVLVAFTISGILQNIKSLVLTKNYTISGIIGVIVGVLYYLWAKDNLESLIFWLQEYGLYLLLIIIFLSAALLYFFKGHKKEQALPNPKAVEVEKEAAPKTPEA